MRGDTFRCVLCTEYRLDGGTWHPYGATRPRHAAFVDDAVWRARGADDDDARGAPVGFEYRIYVAYTSQCVGRVRIAVRTNSARESIALGDHKGAMSNGDAGKVADERCALLDMLPEDLVREILHRAIPDTIVALFLDEHQTLRNLTLTCKTFKDALENHNAWTDLTHYYCATVGVDMADERCYEVLIAKIREHHKITRDVHIVMGRVISERYFPVVNCDVEEAFERIRATAAKRMVIFGLIFGPDDEENFVNYMLCEHWGDAIIIDSLKLKRGEPVALHKKYHVESQRMITAPTSEMMMRYFWSEMTPKLRAGLFPEEQFVSMVALLLRELGKFSVFQRVENYRYMCQVPLMLMVEDTVVGRPLHKMCAMYELRWCLPKGHADKVQVPLTLENGDDVERFKWST
jgi:hypothetical protein